MATLVPTLLLLDTCDLDLEARTVRYRDGTRARLTTTEVDLLRWLARSPGEPHPRDVLLVAVWGYHPNVRSRTVDVTVRRLRQKIERDPSQPEHLVTRRGSGYLLQGVRHGREVRQATNLRPATDRYIEGQPTLAATTALLQPGVVVTLTGAPGVGKSRLATELGRRATELDGVWWCNGAALHSAPDLDLSLAAAMGLDSEGPNTLRATLRATERCLLILDDVDHLDGVVAWLDTLLGAVPRLCVLATGRRALGVSAEVAVRVRPLATDKALALFADRAAVAAGRPLNQEERATLRQALVGRDGLPLALELFAARCAVLPPAALAEHLRSAEPDTLLEGTFAAAWDRLQPDEQRTLALCSVFQESFDVVDATALDDARDPFAVAESLHALFRASLLRRLHGDEPRFAMLRSLRAYARSQLAALADTDAVQARHAERVLADAEADDRRPPTADLLAVLQRARHQGDPTTLARCVLAMGEASAYREHPAQLSERLALLDGLPLTGALAVRRSLHQALLMRADGDTERALAHVRALWEQLDQWVGADDPVRGRVALQMSYCLHSQGDPDAPRWADRAASLGSDAVRGRARLVAASQLLMTDMLAASRARLDDIGKLAQRRHQAEIARLWSVHLIHAGDPKAAEDRLCAALALEPGGRQQAKLMLDLSRALAAQGRVAAALAVLEETIVLSDELGFMQGSAVARSNSASLLHRLGRLEDATSRYEQAIDAGTKCGTPTIVAMARANLALLRFERGQQERGAHELDRAIEEQRTRGHTRPLCWFLACRAVMAMTDHQLEQARSFVAEANLARKSPELGTVVDVVDHAVGALERGESPADLTRWLDQLTPTANLIVPVRLLRGAVAST